MEEKYADLGIVVAVFGEAAIRLDAGAVRWVGAADG
jgi:hypothetical protein